jgi:hypothetical protein
MLTPMMLLPAAASSDATLGSANMQCYSPLIAERVSHVSRYFTLFELVPQPHYKQPTERERTRSISSSAAVHDRPQASNCSTTASFTPLLSK